MVQEHGMSHCTYNYTYILFRVNCVIIFTVVHYNQGSAWLLVLLIIEIDVKYVAM